MSISKLLQDKIASTSQGWVFCANDFSDIGTRVNIDVILHRLAKKSLSVASDMEFMTNQ
ncbi:MAG: hypothetical protein WCP46_04410 [Alphaproteobacteria bacterium]